MVKLIIFIIILSILFNIYDSFIKPMHKKRLIEEENKMKQAIKAEKEFQIQKAYEQKIKDYENDVSVYDKMAYDLIGKPFFKALIDGIYDKMISEIDTYHLTMYQNDVDFGYYAWLRTFIITIGSKSCYLHCYYDEGPHRYDEIYYEYLNTRKKIDEIIPNDISILKRALRLSGLFLYEYENKNTFNGIDHYTQQLKTNLCPKYGTLKSEYDSMINEYKKKQEYLHKNLFS